MKKFLLKFLIITISLNLTCIYCFAEIIDVRNEEKKFGEWKVLCEIDDMMSYAHCKIATKFYDNSSVITLQPFAKFANQFFIIIPQVAEETFVKIRVDQNDLLFSKNVSHKEFGMIPLEDSQKNNLFLQMKTGEYLFLRFNVKGNSKEITTKINLREFRDALEYYNQKASK